MKSNKRRGLKYLVLTSAMALMASATSVSAEESLTEGWTPGLGLYFWGASIGGKTATGSDIDVGIDTLVRNLNMAFMGNLTARKDKVTLAMDVIYLNVGANNNGDINLPITPGGINIPVESRIQMKAWVLTPNIRYNVIETDKAKMDVLAGARYLWLDAELKATVKGPLQNRTPRIADSDGVWDGIVGVVGEVNLNDKWYAPYYLDVGAGGSNFTWQAMAGVGYRFDKFDAILTYRHMDWDFDDNDVFDDLNLSGPMIGIKGEF